MVSSQLKSHSTPSSCAGTIPIMLLPWCGESECFKLVRLVHRQMFPCSCCLNNRSVKLHWTHLYLKLREAKGLSQGYNEPRTKRTGSYGRKGWILEELGEEEVVKIIKI